MKTNIMSKSIEEILKEFDKKVVSLPCPCGKKDCEVKMYLTEDILDFISASIEQHDKERDEELREKIEKLHWDYRGEECSCHINSPCDSCIRVDHDIVDSHNEVVDSVLSLLPPIKS